MSCRAILRTRVLNAALASLAIAGCSASANDPDTEENSGAADIFGVSDDELRAQINAEVANGDYVPPDMVTDCTEGDICASAFRDENFAPVSPRAAIAIPLRFAVFGTQTFRSGFGPARLASVLGGLNHAYNPENGARTRGRGIARFVFDNVAAENVFDAGPDRVMSVADTRSWVRDYHARTQSVRRDRLTLYFFSRIDGVAGFSIAPASGRDLPSPGVFMSAASIRTDSDARLLIGHELGHWLGLEHTFRGGCDTTQRDDLVSDTPRHRNGFLDIWTAIAPCNNTLDTCSDDPGTDPVLNYMSYSNCDQNEFTPLQFARMHSIWARWYESGVRR